jgi:hypothetical protein
LEKIQNWILDKRGVYTVPTAETDLLRMENERLAYSDDRQNWHGIAQWAVTTDVTMKLTYKRAYNVRNTKNLALHTPERHMGGVVVQLHSFLNSALDGGG